jgi:hypothetical protein
MLKPFIISCIFFIGCAPSFITLKQFIDVDDLIKLEPNMKRKQVSTFIGTPKAIRSGIILKSGDFIEIWVYSVREKLMLIPSNQSNVKPISFKADTWGNEREYALYFFNDRLIKWGYIDDDWIQFDKLDGDILTPIPFRYHGDSSSNKITVRMDKQKPDTIPKIEQ